MSSVKRDEALRTLSESVGPKIFAYISARDRESASEAFQKLDLSDPDISLDTVKGHIETFAKVSVSTKTEAVSMSSRLKKLKALKSQMASGQQSSQGLGDRADNTTPTVKKSAGPSASKDALPLRTRSLQPSQGVSPVKPGKASSSGGGRVTAITSSRAAGGARTAKLTPTTAQSTPWGAGAEISYSSRGQNSTLRSLYEALVNDDKEAIKRKGIEKTSGGYSRDELNTIRRVIRRIDWSRDGAFTLPSDAATSTPSATIDDELEDLTSTANWVSSKAEDPSFKGALADLGTFLQTRIGELRATKQKQENDDQAKLLRQKTDKTQEALRTSFQGPGDYNQAVAKTAIKTARDESHKNLLYKYGRSSQPK